jgi:hypothetical protein
MDMIPENIKLQLAKFRPCGTCKLCYKHVTRTETTRVFTPLLADVYSPVYLTHGPQLTWFYFVAGQSAALTISLQRTHQTNVEQHSSPISQFMEGLCRSGDTPLSTKVDTKFRRQVASLSRYSSLAD